MIDLAPFESAFEHAEYCEAAGVPFEDGSLGFKIFSDDEKLGLCSLKFVGEAVYVLNVTAIDEKISQQMLANVFTSVVQFLKHLEINSVVYPVQSESDREIAERVGFDRISPTLYVFDFPSDDCDCCDEHCNHSHGH